MPIIGGSTPRLQKWDPVSQTRVDLSPQLSANLRIPFPFYDGRYLWMARLPANTSISAYDELSFGVEHSFSVGITPSGLWGDGRYLWTINGAGVVNANDIEAVGVVHTINLPNTNYTGLTGDGRYLWTVSIGANQVQKFDMDQGTIIDTFTPPANTSDLHFDGRFLWIYTGADVTQGTIKQYDPVQGTQIDSFNVTNFGLSQLPGGICGDGRYLYVIAVT